MVSPTAQSTDVTWLLTSLVQRVPHTRSALLLSSDGLVKAFHGLDTDGADHLAAVASALFSLGRSVGTRFGSGEQVRQVVVELDSSLRHRLRDGATGQERAPVPGHPGQERGHRGG